MKLLDLLSLWWFVIYAAGVALLVTFPLWALGLLLWWVLR